MYIEKYKFLAPFLVHAGECFESKDDFYIYMSKDDFHVVLKKNAARKYLAAKLSVV